MRRWNILNLCLVEVKFDWLSLLQSRTQLRGDGCEMVEFPQILKLTSRGSGITISMKAFTGETRSVVFNQRNNNVLRRVDY
ncbi:hypothetical protein NPIL_699061 [Nephila pilipes]|uniref:Uncharacterized protein n=1 Tax=Nephila pilipes TaxID=299642 RepID=A0A8X6PEX9_NEPPI|nr:hypothetical protein NPIL_699061 [Nephila pilipes]